MHAISVKKNRQENIADDLVAYVDRHYRTIANRMSRVCSRASTS